METCGLFDNIYNVNTIYWRYLDVWYISYSMIIEKEDCEKQHVQLRWMLNCAILISSSRSTTDCCYTIKKLRCSMISWGRCIIRVMWKNVSLKYCHARSNLKKGSFEFIARFINFDLILSEYWVGNLIIWSYICWRS